MEKLNSSMGNGLKFLKKKTIIIDYQIEGLLMAIEFKRVNEIRNMGEILDQ